MVYEQNQTRLHPLDKTHPLVAAAHIPLGYASWNMSCCHSWMSFVSWMSPRLIFLIFHSVHPIFHSDHPIFHSAAPRGIWDGPRGIWGEPRGIWVIYHVLASLGRGISGSINCRLGNARECDLSTKTRMSMSMTALLEFQAALLPFLGALNSLF